MSNSYNDFYKKGLIPKAFMPDWRYWGHVPSAYAIDLAELTVGIEPTILYSKKNKNKLNELKVVLKHQDPKDKDSEIDAIASRVSNLNKSINSAVKAGVLKGKHNFNTNCYKIDVSDYAAWLKEKNIKSSDELKKHYKPTPLPEEQSVNETKDNLKYNRQIIAALLDSLIEAEVFKKGDQVKFAEILSTKYNYITISDSSINKIFAAANRCKK